MQHASTSQTRNLGISPCSLGQAHRRVWRIRVKQAEYFSTATTNLAEHHKTMLRATVLALRQTAYCNHKLIAEHHKTMLRSTVLALLASSVLHGASQNNAFKHGTCSTGKQRTATIAEHHKTMLTALAPFFKAFLPPRFSSVLSQLPRLLLWLPSFASAVAHAIFQDLAGTKIRNIFRADSGVLGLGPSQSVHPQSYSEWNSELF